MTFWGEVFPIFIGDVFAIVLVVVFYVMIQWFLRATAGCPTLRAFRRGGI